MSKSNFAGAISRLITRHSSDGLAGAERARSQRTRSLALVALTLVALFPWSGQAAEPAEQVDFAQAILPILREHCWSCHGPQQQESNYRLDQKASALRGGDSGQPPIVAGQPAASRLLQVIQGTDADGLVMPPAEEGKPLAEEQIAALVRWIEEGAEWPDDLAGVDGEPLRTDHWSFQPLAEVDVPALRGPTVRNPVDAFVQERLRQEQLSAAPLADRARLIRRMYLDLLGLPPTPAEVAAFRDDPRPDAWERLVDQVLASPHYGERWARHWLDVIRFGESHGFETNPERPRAYPYRDYVITALNVDLPYDRFVREQIAGDALGADVATGFLVAGPYDQVKSPDINLTLMQRQDELADIINTTGTAFLGLTVGCARCHNHKFDPILQQDYYALQAVFAGVQHGERPLHSAASAQIQQQLANLRQRQVEVERELTELERRAVPLAAGEGPSLREPVNARHNIERFAPRPARWIRFTILSTAGQGEPCLDELEVFAAADPTAQSLDSADSAGELSSTRPEQVNVALAATGAKAMANGTLPGYAIHQLEHINDGVYGNDHSWISDRPGSGWVTIELPATVMIERIEWGRDREQQFADRVATEYHIEVATEPDAWQTVASSADRQPFAGATTDPYAFIERLPADLQPSGRALREELSRLRTEIERLQAESMPTAYIGSFAAPGVIHRLYRGDPLAPREEVQPNAIRSIGELELPAQANEQQRRLALANWLTRPTNPLTARVLVNRVWQYHFGTGIVPTPSDFGAAGVVPSHPELLDWLAGELIRNDWSIKWLHRTILLSHTYRQASVPHPAGLAADATTRLLWRFPPRRLEAEAIRDCMLHVSGALNHRGGGRGFLAFDVQQETVHHYFPKTQWGPNEWRRMIYMTKIRQQQDAVFGIFDCPDGGQVMPNRSRSTTPLQALNLLNSQFVVQQAELLAARLQLAAPDDSAAQVTQAFDLLYARAVDDNELRWSVELIEEYGLVAFCRALLNSNEFLFLN